MDVTRETSVECRPLIDSMLATQHRVHMLGEIVQEWRVHPIGLYVLMAQTQRRYRSQFGGIGPSMSSFFGARLIEDVNVKPRRCKVVVRRDVTRLDWPPKEG